ncbi:putative Rho GDP-dissociation inhibitor 1 [Dioszegia hungarica]|uniref:Rho GDP-dissociation inhibitor 1 n=1 Tax=Dioszegia hungarica TaxID=4972 RepID=A0AA38HBJ5_9TREE|nr:putative Rho GDP-dissociation inhibitor 1 [Dioszegia hungarica]KAI9637413.1 putative Rho GDP-dissociation inhibitor 1 [Dioszegia hungarica]
MTHQQQVGVAGLVVADGQPTEDELVPSQTEGYKVGQQRSVAELAELDKEDESLQRWKQSLGLSATAGGGTKKVVPKTLFLSSEGLHKPVEIDLTRPAAELAKLKKEPMTIKEGVEYSVGITFVVENEIVSGLKYLQVVKRSGIKVDKVEAMLGSYGPNPKGEVYTKVFASEESPSGMLARSGTYTVQSRVMDDDQHVWLDVEWGELHRHTELMTGFKLAKEW